MKFKGITSEFRQTDEYKQLYSYIMAECPHMTPYLAEMGIHKHKTDPEYYKKGNKMERDAKRNPQPFKDIPNTVLNTVGVYDDPNHPDLAVEMMSVKENN